MCIMIKITNVNFNIRSNLYVNDLLRLLMPDIYDIADYRNNNVILFKF